jgi:hypothetical protein
MVLGIKPSDPQFAGRVMHEFGHALGAEHEHQHLPRRHSMGSRFTCLLRRQGTLEEGNRRRKRAQRLPEASAQMLPYDRDSIMHYPIDNALTLGNGRWEAIWW